MMLAINILIVIGIGFLTGTLELIQRYPETKYLVKKQVLPFALLYGVFNGMVALIALLFIWHFKEIDFLSLESINLVYICTAGFGGMAILRSSFFTIKVNGQDVNVGLAQFVTIIMTAFDRKISTERAPIKYDEIVELAKGLNFKDMLSIISQCDVFTKHITSDTRDDLIDVYNEVRDNAELSEEDKVIQVLCEISEFSDTKILKAIASRKAQKSDSETQKKHETTDKESLDYYLEKLSKKIKRDEE